MQALSVLLKSPFSKGDQDYYQRLPTSNALISGPQPEITLDLLENERCRLLSGRRQLLYHRSTYYWISFVSISLQMLLEVVALYMSSWRGSVEKADGIARFVTTCVYSSIALGFTCVLLWWQYKKQANIQPPSKVNAQAHVALCLCTSLICLFVIMFMFLLDDSKEGIILKDSKRILIALSILLSVISAGSLCIAARITYLAAVRARGTGRVPIPARPPPTVAAWMLASTSESQSISAEPPA